MESNKALFYNIIYSTTFDVHERYNIGTYKEKKLHIILKKYFESDDSFHEVPTNGFIADIRRGKEITEIETSGFSGLSPKLSAYLPEYKVNLVYPIAAKKYVSWIDPETSEISKRHISPKKQTVYDALFELVRILPHVSDPNLRILVPVLEVDEYRMLDGWSYNRKRGSHRFERMPTNLIDIIEISTDRDYLKYIPENCSDVFGASEFAKGCKIDSRSASAILKVMEARGVLVRVANKGRAYQYTRN
jgi:hypothetical protein